MNSTLKEKDSGRYFVTKVAYRKDEELGWYYEAYERDEEGDDAVLHASTSVQALVGVADLIGDMCLDATPEDTEHELKEALARAYPNAKIVEWEES